jgi:hypothetical protein
MIAYTAYKLYYRSTNTMYRINFITVVYVNRSTSGHGVMINGLGATPSPIRHSLTKPRVVAS